MTLLILGLLLFFATHALPMAPALRERVRTTLSAGGYRVLFAFLSALALVLIVIGYGQMRGHVRGNPELWTPPAGLRHVTLLLMLPALILLVAAYVPSRIRTAVKHPMLAAIKLWALAHLLANGDLASVLLFGGFLLWAGIDRASVGRRNAPGPLGVRSGGLAGDALAVAGGLAIYLILVLWGHRWLFGVSPLA